MSFMKKVKVDADYVPLERVSTRRSKMEKDREPGTAKFGNFINYYSFNPARRRIDLISVTILRQVLKETTDRVLCLDIGCNSGVAHSQF